MKLVTLAVILAASYNQAKRPLDDIQSGKKIKAFAIKIKSDGESKQPPQYYHQVDGRRRRDSDDTDSSSSRELDDWKDEWRNMWLEKKFEYMNASRPYRGDVVNMAAARPWGVRCGDPGQHDVLWGTCMLPMECEPEFRIYRGDHFCGRTEFICCALETANYDLYHGFEATFEHSSLETDSQDKSDKDNSRQRRERRKERERNKRRRNREQRQKKIRRTIKKIVKEIRKLLNKNKKNVTRDRKRKSKQLYRYLKHLKLVYKKDWETMRDIHEIAIIKLDKAFVNKLEEVVGVNKRFMENETFRKIVTEGMVSKKIARDLVSEFPELAPYLPIPLEELNASSGRRLNDDDYDFDY